MADNFFRCDRIVVPESVAGPSSTNLDEAEKADKEKSQEQNNNNNNNVKDKEGGEDMLSVHSISANLSTDSTNCAVRNLPRPRRMCFCLPTTKVSVFGVVFTTILMFAIFVFSIIHLAQNLQKSSQFIVIVSLFFAVQLIFGTLFLWGLFTTRPRLLLPYIIYSIFLLFAIAGSLIASIVTIVEDFNQTTNPDDNHHKVIWHMILFRVALLIVLLIEMVFVYAYIGSYFFSRATARVLKE